MFGIVIVDDENEIKRAEEYRNEEIVEKLQINRSTLRDYVLNALLNGWELLWQSKDIMLNEFSYDLCEGMVQVAILEVSDLEADKNKLYEIEDRKAIYRVIKENIKRYAVQYKTFKCLIVEGDVEYVKLVLQPQGLKQSDTFYKQTADFFDFLQKDINEKFAIGITIGVGNIYNSLTEANLSYLDAKDALKHKYVLGENRVIHYGRYADSFSLSLNISIEKEKHLASCIIDGNSECFSVIDDIFNGICRTGRTDLYSACIDLNYLLANIAKQLECKYLSLNKICNITELTEISFANCINLTNIKNCFINTVTKLLEVITKYYINHKNNVISNICKYVLSNIDTNITLRSISGQFYISTNYLSYLFKEQTGENFQNYLSRLKIERAKYLLKNSNYKAYEVGNMLGYHEPAYFSRLFRKYTGCNPTEYRKTCL